MSNVALSHSPSNTPGPHTPDPVLPGKPLPAPDYARPGWDEPFGQIGVRKFIGRILAWVCIIISACSLAMGNRSSMFDDAVQWKSPDGVLSIHSVFGRILITGSDNNGPRNAGAGWSYHSRFIGNTVDGWQPSLWKAIGIEISSDPLPGDSSGFWIRVKWTFIAILFSIQPVVYFVLAIRRYRAYRA